MKCGGFPNRDTFLDISMCGFLIISMCLEFMLGDVSMCRCRVSNMCRKFHLKYLKTEGGVLNTTFQQTNHLDQPSAAGTLGNLICCG